MTKYWKTDATRDGKPVRLYIAISDEILAEDLACGAGYSLTLMGRQDNYRRNPTPDTDHVDFATGAFLARLVMGFNSVSLSRKLIRSLTDYRLTT